MKNHRTIAFSLCFVFCSIVAAAQQKEVPLNQPDYNKAELFRESPDRITVETFELTRLLTIPIGEPVLMNLPSFRFDGTVISTVSKYGNKMQSIVIRSSNYEGATLTITKTIDETGNILYRGRILSMKHGDVYELKQDDNGFALVKNKFNNVITE